MMRYVAWASARQGLLRHRKTTAHISVKFSQRSLFFESFLMMRSPTHQCARVLLRVLHTRTAGTHGHVRI